MRLERQRVDEYHPIEPYRSLPHSGAIFALIALCLLLKPSLGAQVKPIRRILILNEVGTSYPLINMVDQGIQSALANSPFRIEFYREYMDTTLFPDPADQQLFRDFYVHKYQNRRPKVIITVGSSPLRFMVEAHRQFFPGVPIVFCLPNSPHGGPTIDSDFTGVEGDIAPAATLAAALRLRPDTKHVVVVGGTALYDRQQQNEVKERLKGYANRLDIAYLTDLAMPALLERLGQLPGHTIVLLTALGRDANGTSYISTEVGPMIVTAANAPVFSLSAGHLGHGEVGGDISNGTEEGTIVGRMALRILKGERPEDIPPIKTATTYTFDWRALKRWGLRESDLPPGSVVLNRQLTFWEEYREYLIPALLVLLAQTVAILALLWQTVNRKRAQTALKKSEEKFSKAFHQSPLSFTLATLVDYRILEVNDTFERYTGWKREEVIGRTSLQIQFWVDMQQRSTFIDQLRAKGTVRNLEILFRKKHGEVRTAVISSELIELNGEPCALSLMADITEAKQAENARRESEQRFRLIANTAPVMIWMADTDKLCNYVNQPWLEFTGRSLETELGNGWAEGIHPEDLKPCLAKYLKAFDERGTFKMEYRMRRHDGEYRWIFDIGVPRFEPDGSFAGYIGSCLDVTERKLAEEALSSIGRRLIQAQEQERTRIARELHDDINQRVAMLAIELDALQQEQHPAGSTVALGSRLDGLRERLLELGTEIQAISHRLHSSKLEYLGLVAASRSFCKEVAERHKVTVDFAAEAVPSSVPQNISLCLFRVLQEALTNAIKHSGTEHFEVRLRGLSDEVQLVVRDHGVGIDEAMAMNTQGLGLISLRERVGLVGGTLSIASQPMGGTEITARIPLVQAASQMVSGAA